MILLQIHVIEIVFWEIIVFKLLFFEMNMFNYYYDYKLCYVDTFRIGFF